MRGSIATIAAAGAFEKFIVSEIAGWASCWSTGSIVVVTVRPPRFTANLPYLCFRSWRTYSTKYGWRTRVDLVGFWSPSGLPTALLKFAVVMSPADSIAAST